MNSKLATAALFVAVTRWLLDRLCVALLPQKPLEMVSVQAAAGPIIYKAMRVFYQSRKVELEEYGATSMLWEYTVMEWEHGPFSAARGVGGGEGALDIKQEQMERSTIPETTLYIKREGR